MFVHTYTQKKKKFLYKIFTVLICLISLQEKKPKHIYRFRQKFLYNNIFAL